MKTDSESSVVTFDRRQIYRPFLDRLSPIASAGALLDDELIVARNYDPLDAGQPPIHIAFADTAELSRGMQMALVGGIGSGKSTELLLTQKVLGRHADAVNILADLADYTDLNELNTGAILATAGMRLYSHLEKTSKKLPDRVKSAHTKLWKLAFGETIWGYPEPELDDGYEDSIPIEFPG